MPHVRLQFRLADLIAATALVAAVLTSAVYLPSASRTDGAAGLAIISLLIVFAWMLGGICFCFRRLRMPAMIAMLLVCGVFSLRQARLMERLRLLEVEVPRIVAHIEKYQTANEGEYPRDLSAYVFERPELRAYVRYLPPRDYDPRTRADASPYAVRYHPNAESDYSSWYTSAGEYWYDDD